VVVEIIGYIKKHHQATYFVLLGLDM